MNDQIVMTEIRSLFTFLKYHIEINTKSSFNDVGLSLETFFMDLFNVIEGNNCWRNANSITFNYPAIDLINDGKKQAIQITTTANKRKIDKTIQTYNKYNFNYNSLIIIGFLDYTKFNQNNVISVGLEYIINQIKGCSLVVKGQILNLIRETIPVQLLVPYNDNNCFQIIFNTLNRSAIRDDVYSEGNYEDMVRGLKDVKSLITSGEIRGTDIKTKPLSCYSEPLQSELASIEYKVSKIIQICNKANNNGMVLLEWESKCKIDNLKEEIIECVNDICKRHKIEKKIIR